MKNKTFWLGIISLLAVATAVYFIKFNLNDSNSSVSKPIDNNETIPKISVEEVDVEWIESFTDAELVYAKQYKTNPFAKHIRVAINGYLDKTNTGAEWESTRTIEGNSNCGMAKFEEYLSSKYIVISIGEGTYGGEIIKIVFVDKPDTVFSVWVYDLGDGALGYDLRSFCDTGRSEKSTKILLKAFGNLISDKSNGL